MKFTLNPKKRLIVSLLSGLIGVIALITFAAYTSWEASFALFVVMWVDNISTQIRGAGK